MISRRSLCALCALGWLLEAAPAWAGSYLDRAALLVEQSTRSNDYLRKRPYDRELARVVANIAEGCLRAGKDTVVPKEVALAHPHLLLMLEHYERAASAAADGEVGRYVTLSRSARDEEQLFRGVLRQLGWTLPPSKSA